MKNHATAAAAKKEKLAQSAANMAAIKAEKAANKKANQEAYNDILRKKGYIVPESNPIGTMGSNIPEIMPVIENPDLPENGLFSQPTAEETIDTKTMLMIGAGVVGAIILIYFLIKKK